MHNFPGPMTAAVARLSRLGGVWRGNGTGRYPTIASFDYEELLTFELNLHYPLLHYEQRTRLLPDREPGHWESGFFRPLTDGAIEISSAQDSGRVEVLRGRFPDDGDSSEDFSIELQSIVLGNDDRLVATSRRFTLRGNSLHYLKMMSTHTTDIPKMQFHLEALLHRIEN